MSGFEISPDELDKDRTIIDAERSYQEAHIAVRIGETTEQMAFTRHPYKWAPMGLREHLNAISADDIISYYETHYRPDNLTLVVAGDIKQEKIADYWSSGLRCLSLDKTQTPIARPWSGEEPVQKDYREWRTQESGPPYIHVHFKAPRAGSRDALAMMVISAALGGAKMSSLPFGPNRIGQEASILYRTLIRSEIATDIKCGYRRSLDPHAFDIMVTCNRNVETDLVLKSITDTIERISSIGLTEDELTHGKACVEAASRFRLEQGLGKVLEHGHAHSVDAYQRFANLNKELTSLKSSRIAEACRRYLDLDSASVGLNLPGRFEIKDVGGGD